MIKTVADTIVWMARERMKTEAYKTLVSAIHAIDMEIGLILGEEMRRILEDKRQETPNPLNLEP